MFAVSSSVIAKHYVNSGPFIFNVLFRLRKRTSPKKAGKQNATQNRMLSKGYVDAEMNMGIPQPFYHITDGFMVQHLVYFLDITGVAIPDFTNGFNADNTKGAAHPTELPFRCDDEDLKGIEHRMQFIGAHDLRPD
jgi:hypothetical protein